MSDPGAADRDPVDPADPDLRIGDPAPDFTLPGVDGRNGGSVEVYETFNIM